MSWSISCGSGRTRAYGGLGGGWFDENLGREFIKSINAVYSGDHIYAVQITATDGHLYTYGRPDKPGSRSATFRFDFEGAERMSRMEFYIFTKDSVVRCGGVAIVTNEQTAKIGPLKGMKYVINFQERDAKLIGFCGRAGEDLDALGFRYYLACNVQSDVCCLPAEKYTWMSPQSSKPELSHSLYLPFEEIARIELSTENNRVVGICVEFEDGTTRLAGSCKDLADMAFDLSKNKVITQAEVYESEDGLLTAVGLVYDGVKDDAEWIVVNPSTTRIHKFSDIHAKLVGIQCSLNEAGYVDALALLFSSPFEMTPLGMLPSIDASNEGNGGAFKDANTKRRLSSMSSFSEDGIIRGIMFKYSDGAAVCRGETEGGKVSTVEFPTKANAFDIRVKFTSANDVAGIHFTCDKLYGMNWSGALGEDASTEPVTCTVSGSLTGAFAEVVNNALRFGIVSISPVGATPLYGKSNTGAFFDTACLYGTGALVKRSAVSSIGVWLDRKQHTVNGLQVHKSVSLSSTRHISNIGTQNGVFSKINFSVRFELRAVNVAVKSQGSDRINGIDFVGHEGDKEFGVKTIGKMTGDIQRYEFGEGRTLAGLYGTCEKGVPSSVGFVVDHGCE